MSYEEAQEWLKGNRSMTNSIPSSDLDTWQVRIAQADAMMMIQAYIVTLAHQQGLVKP